MNFFLKPLTALTVAAGLFLTSCQDDLLDPNGSSPGFGNQAGVNVDEPLISFDLELPALGDDNTLGGNHLTSDMGDYGDNYIDPTNIRVLFFSGAADPDGSWSTPGGHGSFDDPVIPGSYGNKYLFEVNHNDIYIVKLKDNLSFGPNESQGYRVTISERKLFNQVIEEGQTDVNGNPVTIERFNKALREALMGVYDKTTKEYKGNGFKIVVLANFPKQVEGKRNYDPFTGDPIMGDETYPTNNLHLTFGDDLSELSQCVYDNVYGDRYNTTLEGTPRNLAYKHFPYDDLNDGSFELGGRMGVYSVWVKNYFKDFTVVSDFLRDPKRKSGETYPDENGFLVGFLYGRNDDGSFIPYSYFRSFDSKYPLENSYVFENVWRVWNFSGGEHTQFGYIPDSHGKTRGTNGYHTTNSDVAKYWKERNEENVIKPAAQGETSLDGLDLGSKASFDAANGCIKLETTVPNSQTYPSADDLNKAIHLKIFGEGTLHIKAIAPDKADGTQGNGRLMVTGKTTTRSKSGTSDKRCEHIYPIYGDDYYYRTDDEGNFLLDGNGNMISMGGYEAEGVTSVYPGRDMEQMYELAHYNKDGGYGWEYIIEPNSNPYVDVYIHAYGGTIYIYEIEFVRDRHLYDTGRVGILPSEDNPIPMYGCQEFDPIGKFVDMMREATDDGVFNSSDRSANIFEADPNYEYKYKRVYLLRSIAKVEVLFKKSTFKNHKPTHLYMRTINRSARCEPKDVITPTEVLWFGSQYLEEHSANLPGYYIRRYDPHRFAGIDVENNDIRNFGPLHEAGNSSLPSYYDKTAWFYGMWQEWRSHRMPTGWDWNFGKEYGPASKPDPNAYSSNTRYPRIFNTRVDRSDFCRLHYAGEVHVDGETYMKYVIYLPEKNIDDADDKGDLSANSKVAHLELRFEGMNDTNNMDDEHIYRVYFADYKTYGNELSAFDRNEWDNMEKQNTDNFLGKYCYPIIRNHIYRFKINSINGNKIGVDFEVVGPQGRNYPGNVTFN